MSDANPFQSPQARPEKPSPSSLPPVRETPPEARTMAMLAHLLGALLGFLGPLIIWLVKRDEHPFIDDQGKEALNFQLAILIAYVVVTAAYFVIALVTCGFGAFIPLPLVVTVLQIVFGILGATAANRGEYYRYPLTIRMIQ